MRAVWWYLEIAEAYACRTKTIENIRHRFCKSGFEMIRFRDDTQRSAASGASTSLKFDGEVKQCWLPSVLANGQGVTRTVRLVFLPDTFYFARVVLVWRG